MPKLEKHKYLQGLEYISSLLLEMSAEFTYLKKMFRFQQKASKTELMMKPLQHVKYKTSAVIYAVIFESVQTSLPPSTGLFALGGLKLTSLCAHTAL